MTTNGNNIQNKALLNREEIAFLLQAFDSKSDNICTPTDKHIANIATQAIQSVLPEGRISILPQSPQPKVDGDLHFSLSVASGKVQCLISPIDAAVIITAAMGAKQLSVPSSFHGISLNIVNQCCQLLSHATAQALFTADPTAGLHANTVPPHTVLQLDIRGMKATIRLFFDNRLQTDSQPTVATVRTRPVQIPESKFRQWKPGTFIPLSVNSAIPAEIDKQKNSPDKCVCLPKKLKIHR